MVHAAQVIVDLPLMQTDQAFSYKIPSDYVNILQLGMRVHVPFGRSNRLLQGFVVGFEESQMDDLKDIVSILDLEPVLNQEQLYLANQMRKTVFSYKISLLKAMIPSLLNSTYDKLLKPSENLSTNLKEKWFGQKENISFSQLASEDLEEVQSLLQKDLLEISYVAQDKKQIKTEEYYTVNHSLLEKTEFSTRAKKRLSLKEYLLEHREGKVADLTKLFTSPVVKYFISKNLLGITQKEVMRSQGYFNRIEKTEFLDLNEEQSQVVQEITAAIGQDKKPFLLEGVTGSGKTEVYLHTIDQTLKMGKTAIVLVPEIALTPQMTQRFISRFGDQVAIMHSGLSDGEKFDEWRKIKNGSAKVVVGARSAIFAPLENIGAIIIDEEHEATYKQESNPRYHARDVAILRAKYHQAALVLGSATPSIESRARASKAVYHFLKLTKRANPNATIPKVEVVDFRDYIGQQETTNYTPYLLEEIQKRLEQKEQVVLMLNKRGYSSFMMCRDCGYVDKCPNCDISLTLHMDTKSMNCHYCGHIKSIPRTCPNCKQSHIRYYGTGTQKAYDELTQYFPQARILRMDVDTTRKKGAHEKLLKIFEKGEADILLGTQMIAKGLDFPNVTLVGVLNADTSLYLPDFRSSERTFQLLTQVAGRAGRADKKGEVLIQTYNPNHYAIQLAKNQDYESFYEYELKIRQQLGYPPYYFTVGLTLSHKNEEEVVKKSYEVLELIRQNLSSKIKILGPTPKPIARTHNLYHYQIVLSYRFEENLEVTLNQILEMTQLPENKTFRIMIDTEPQSFM